MAADFNTQSCLARWEPSTLDDLNVDDRVRLTIRRQISNYREGDEDGGDVVGDLKKEIPVDASNRFKNPVDKVHHKLLARASAEKMIH